MYKRQYQTCMSHTKEFLKWKFKVSDIDIKKIDYAFLNDFEFYLRTEKSCNNNSAVKYLKNFGKIIRICLANGWLDKDPYLNYQSKFNEVTRVFLNEDELENPVSYTHLDVYKRQNVKYLVYPTTNC